ncbi:MAG: large repetitive protein [Chthoniobacter sp.]|jgi:hypothetical protein|nr:large repetitive protein [Chthoniobacter sp.]
MKQSHIEPLEARIAPAGLSIADAQVVEGDSGTKTLDFTVTLTGAITSNVTVNFATTDNSANVASGDYFATSGALTFTPSGPATKNISVRIHGDTSIESNEVFFVDLKTPTGATLDDSHAVGTIVNDDPNLRITDVTVTEGDTGSQSAVFVVSLSSNPNQTVLVDYTTVDGTAVDGVGDGSIVKDYEAKSGTLTFPAGTLTKTIPVTILGDRVKELSQNTFTVVLSNARTAGSQVLTIADATGVGTILDNDAAPTLSIDDKTVAENIPGGKATFTVKLTQLSDLPITVDYATVNGTGTQGAVGGSDFTAQTGTLTIAPGTLSKTIDVAVTNDATVEADETFSVRLSNAKLNLPTPQTLTLTKAIGAGAILNDDVTVSLATGTAAENVAGGKLNFLVTLSQAAAADVVLRYSTSDGTAKAPGDYPASTNATLTIPKGQTTGTISIPIINDTLDEANETFTVTLTGVTNAAFGTAIAAQGTITDDDAAPVVTIGNAATAEGTGTNPNAVFTVTLSAISGQDVTVKYATANGTAVAVKDYTAAAATAAITIPAGQKTGTVSIPVIGDALDEADAETFTVTLTGATNGTLGSAKTGTATIQDDDALPTLTIDDVAVAENGVNAVFTVRLTGGTDRTVTAAYATQDNGAVAGSDYTTKTGTVTFLPAETAKQISVPIINDSVSETSEQFFVNLSLLPNGGSNAAINDGQGIGTILNDDATFKIVSFTDGSSAVTAAEEGAAGAAQVVKFKVILENAAPGATTTVNFATVDGTASDRTAAVSSGLRPDFTAQSGTLMFSGAVTEQVISIPITADSSYENNETFTVRLSNPVNAVLKTGLGTGTVTITDNDPKPTLNIEDASILEGDSGAKNLSFKVSLSAANEKDASVTVNYLTADGTGVGGAISVAPKADFTAVTMAPPLTFNPGDVQKTINISILGDTRDEDNQTFTVNLGGLSAGATAGKLIGTGTILDDDAAPFVSIGNLTVGENDNGLPNNVFTVKLVNAANQPVESERVITVNYQTANGTATAPGDYTTTPGQLTFDPGTMQKTIAVPLIDDALNEPSETFQVNLATPTNAVLGVAHGVATIQDNDLPPAITINDVTLVEGDSGTTNAVFTVSLSQASAQTVKVNFATVDGTAKATGPFADYLPQTGTLSFAPGSPLTQTISVPVIGDTLKEADQQNADEQFVVKLSAPVNAVLSDHPSGAAVIQNGSDTTLGLAMDDIQVVEGDSGTADAQFTIMLSAPATGDVPFTVATLNGTAVGGLATDSAADFQSEVGPLKVAATKISQRVGIPIKGDTVFEATESFFLNLTGVPSDVQVVDDDAFAGAQATARAYIFNNDINVLGPGKLQWIDVDGDLVTLTVSKGALSLASGDDLTLVSSGPVGGRQLQLLDLTNDGATFATANVSIIATKQAGFPLPTDGRVDVGEIRAAVFLANELQAIGNDLGVVTVDGDLGKISAGDPFSTPAIVKLDVYSLGARGTATLAPANITEQNTQSKVLGPINTFKVKQNVNGSMFVIGAEFGVINTLNIGGALQGGAADTSGQVVVTGHIGTATIGSIIGGAGQESGLLAANAQTQGRIGNVNVTGAIVGGDGDGSGQIFGTKIGNVSAGEIIGGRGQQSGAINATSTLGSVTLAGDLRGGTGISSGTIFANSAVGAVQIDGSIIGGSQQNTGSLISNGGITSLALTGALRGGAGETSGSVQVNGGGIGAITIGEDPATGDSIVGGAGRGSGSIGVALNITSVSTTGNIRGGSADNSGAITVNGSITKLLVGRSLIGGTAHGPATDGSPAVALVNSGYLKAGRFISATINEDIVAGVDGGAGIANSAAIRADMIDALIVNRDVLGSAATPVVISAAGLNGQAIKSLLVGGKVQFAEILAGYDVDGSTSNFRGTVLNADASIGTVSIGESVQGLNVIAGAQPGADGRFGTADDRLITGGVTLPSGFKTRDVPTVISQIASVIIKGAILPTSAPYGVIAQHIISLKTGPAGMSLGLLAGPGNDLATGATDPDPGVEISPGSKFRAIELPL